MALTSDVGGEAATGDWLAVRSARTALVATVQGIDTDEARSSAVSLVVAAAAGAPRRKRTAVDANGDANGMSAHVDFDADVDFADGDQM